MTRFMMSLKDSLNLVLFAFINGNQEIYLYKNQKVAQWEILQVHYKKSLRKT